MEAVVHSLSTRKFDEQCGACYRVLTGIHVYLSSSSFKAPDLFCEPDISFLASVAHEHPVDTALYEIQNSELAYAQ